jgi:hypothetical protein
MNLFPFIYFVYNCQEYGTDDCLNTFWHVRFEVFKAFFMFWDVFVFHVSVFHYNTFFGGIEPSLLLMFYIIWLTDIFSLFSSHIPSISIYCQRLALAVSWLLAKPQIWSLPIGLFSLNVNSFVFLALSVSCIWLNHCNVLSCINSNPSETFVSNDVTSCFSSECETVNSSD